MVPFSLIIVVSIVLLNLAALGFGWIFTTLALVMRTPDLALARAAIEESLRPATDGPVALGDGDEDIASLHRERLEAQLDRQTAWNEALLRQGAIQSTALSLLTGLSEVLARPQDVRQRLGEVLVHCLDAAGLSTGLLYTAEPGGDHLLQAQFGIPADRKGDAEKAFGHPELVRRVVEVGKPAAFCAANADQETRDFLARLGHSSALVTPLTVLGEPFGALVLGSDAHDLCQTEWTAFARSLAQQFGQTLALGQSMKRLAASEARHSALMENASDAIFVLDTEATVLEANQHAATLLGTPREELIGKHISAFAPAAGPEAEEIAARFQAQLAAGGGRADNVLLRRGDGVLVEVDFAMSLSMVDGQPSVLSIGREVTERNRTGRALRDAQQRLAHWLSLRVRGSAMSRMASAIRLTASTSTNSSTEAPARFHQMTGVRESSLRAWSIIWPQLPSSPMPR